MCSSGAEVKRWTVKFDMSENELMRSIVTSLLEVFCSSFEYVNQEDLNALRSARQNYFDREVNMEALLTEISVVKENCMERMDRVKQAEDSLRTTIEDIRKELEHWPAFAKGSLILVCDEEQKLLSNIAEQRQGVHSKDEVDDASTRIFLFLEYKRQMLTKYFTYTKNDTESNRLDYSTFAAKSAVLDSIGTDRPLHLHDEEQIKHLADKTRGHHEYEECNKYLCPFQHQPHFHECKLSDCRQAHVYICSQTECGQPHCHPKITAPCDGKQCDKYPTVLKFGDSLYFQRKPSEASK